MRFSSFYEVAKHLNKIHNKKGDFRAMTFKNGVYYIAFKLKKYIYSENSKELKEVVGW